MNIAVDEQDAIKEVADNSGLGNDQLITALLDACGAKPKEIADKLGKSVQYVYQIRLSNERYKQTVGEFRRIISRKMVEQFTNVEDLFNSQISSSVACLMDIRDNIWAKDRDRITASLAFLDRAPKAPKSTQQQDIRQQIIQIPIAAMDDMRRALGEVRSGGGMAKGLLEDMSGMVGGILAGEVEEDGDDIGDREDIANEEKEEELIPVMRII